MPFTIHLDGVFFSIIFLHMKKSVLILACCLIWCFLGQLNAQTDSSFKPSGRWNVLLFGDYSYKLHADSLNRGISQYSGVPKTFSNFQIRRFYLGYNYDISQNFTSEFLLAYEDGGGATA